MYFNRDGQDIQDKKSRFTMKGMKKLKFKNNIVNREIDLHALHGEKYLSFFVPFVCFVVKKGFL